MCEKTAALLRAQLTDSHGDADDIAPPPPLKRRRTVERGDDAGAAASSSPRAAASTTSSRSVNTVSTDGRDSPVSWTKKIHTQQADGSWSIAVVPCESRPALVDAALAVAESDVNILARMQDELRREVLDFSQTKATRDLGRVRIASKAVHEAMMGCDLDLSNLSPAPTVDQLMALGRGNTFQKFKQVPVEQRCLCAAGKALRRTGVGSEVSMGGWNAVPDHERLAVGVRRSWRVTCLALTYGVTLEQWRQLLRGLNLADTLIDLVLDFSGGEVDASSTNPSIMSALNKLTYLGLTGVSGSLSFVQNLTRLRELELAGQVSGSLSSLQNLIRLQHLDLNNTQVSGSLAFLQNLTQLQILRLDDSQVSGSLSLLQSLTQLQELNLYNTQLSGSLSFLQNLTQLQRGEIIN